MGGLGAGGWGLGQGWNDAGLRATCMNVCLSLAAPLQMLLFQLSCIVRAICRVHRMPATLALTWACNCHLVYIKRIMPHTFPFCADGGGTWANACRGDSGGPMLLELPGQPPIQVRQW